VRQCERLADQDRRLPALLQGTARAADASELAEFAAFCAAYKQLYRTAARWYAEAFAACPELAEDLEAEHRFAAARAAALAGDGQGKDAGLADAQERARWRKQALDWLRADLVRLGKSADTPAARPAIRKRLQVWQATPHLAPLRDEAGLARLPQDEREACHRLWADLKALLAKVKPAAE
jgi:serine/threonine-protein kinase